MLILKLDVAMCNLKVRAGLGLQLRRSDNAVEFVHISEFRMGATRAAVLTHKPRLVRMNVGAGLSLFNVHRVVEDEHLVLVDGAEHVTRLSHAAHILATIFLAGLTPFSGSARPFFGVKYHQLRDSEESGGGR